MAATGFFEQKQVSPLGFGAVLALHGALIGAVLLVKGPQWMRQEVVDTKTYNVKQIPPPDPDPVPPDPQPRAQPQQLSRIEVTPPIIPPRNPDNVARFEPTLLPPGPIAGNDPVPSTNTKPVEQPRIVDIPPREPVAHTPVRVEAQFDPRFAGAQQPPYPASEVRREREGSVRIRVTIGPDGRVVAAERIDATSDDFWDATRRQALSRWRFRPATVDGRPTQSVKTLSIRFRLDG